MRGRALLFGLNYSGDLKLNGCVNDVHNMGEYLKTTLNIPIDVFTDETSSENTGLLGMVRRLYELALRSHTESLDFAWIHYSGHGSYVKDTSGDETDGNDECLVPSDFETAGLLPDDVIESILRFMNPKTRVVCVFDCCHSGTIGDVKYCWESPASVTVENILCSIPAKVITFSGCLDTQTSADAFGITAQEYQGALTSCMLLVLKDASMSTSRNDVVKVLTEVRARLKERNYAQIPKLCSTYNLARDRVFIPMR